MLMAESPEDFRDDVNTLSAEDGTTWVEIASTGTEDEANLIEGFLRAEEIPAQVENVKFTMEPINFGTMGDIRIYVRAEDEQKAHELLRSREREYRKLDEDGETVVTDEGAAVIEDDTRTEGDDGATS
jgi:hypothetical protein